MSVQAILELISKRRLVNHCVCQVVYDGTSLNCAQLHDNNYQFVYSCHMPTEAAVLGAISLILTVLNIICIFIAGIVVLKVCCCCLHILYQSN